MKCDPLGLWKLHLNGNNFHHKRSSNPVFSSLCSCSVTDSLSLKCSGEFCHSVDHLTVGVQVGVTYFFSDAFLATPAVGRIKSWTLLCSKTALLWQRRGSAAQTQETGREELAASASAKWKGSKHLKTLTLVPAAYCRWRACVSVFLGHGTSNVCVLTAARLFVPQWRCPVTTWCASTKRLKQPRPSCTWSLLEDSTMNAAQVNAVNAAQYKQVQLCAQVCV